MTLREPDHQPFPKCPVEGCGRESHGTVCRRGVYADREFTECGCLGVWAETSEVAS